MSSDQPDHAQQQGTGDPVAAPNKRNRAAFDINNYPQRRVALRVAYHGHHHDGLAKQDHTTNTVEGLLVEALKRVRLIGDDGPQCLSRCGRTDKGVSALGNAFSLIVRASDDPQKPLDYCDKLNHCLPPTIRVIGWAYVADDFDARFSCRYRVYRYYFLNEGMDLNRMREAAAFLVGTHNFRNFCKLDVVNVNNFERTIMHVSITPANSLVSYFEIQGNAFLYHQIRCTMTILFLIGRGLEAPSVVKALLERGDAKPIYALADDSPLILWDCHFDATDVQWQFSDAARQSVLVELQDIATALLVRSVAASAMCQQLLEWAASPSVNADAHTAPGTNSNSASDASWAATGCDWTSERLQGNLRQRRSELHASKKSPSIQQAAYVKLLDREVEASYREKVGGLSGTKRARQEENQAKKDAAMNGAGSNLEGT